MMSQNTELLIDLKNLNNPPDSNINNESYRKKFTEVLQCIFGIEFSDEFIKRKNDIDYMPYNENIKNFLKDDSMFNLKKIADVDYNKIIYRDPLFNNYYNYKKQTSDNNKNKLYDSFINIYTEIKTILNIKSNGLYKNINVIIESYIKISNFNIKYDYFKLVFLDTIKIIIDLYLNNRNKIYQKIKNAFSNNKTFDKNDYITLIDEKIEEINKKIEKEIESFHTNYEKLQKPSTTVYEQPNKMTVREKENLEFHLRNLKLELQFLESKKRIRGENLLNDNENNKVSLEELILQIEQLKLEIANKERSITRGGYKKKRKQMKKYQ